MPELPEVESVRSTLEPIVTSRVVRDVEVYTQHLRWPVAPSLARTLSGQRVLRVQSRAKYLLLGFESGVLVIHQGMSGRLVRQPLGDPLGKHDHVDLVFDNFVLRYNDPRRFGCIEWHAGPPETYPLFKDLGPEPLSAAFSQTHLQQALRRRHGPIKTALVDGKMVAGLGNIYVSEALFRARIHPLSVASKLPPTRLSQLAHHTTELQREAIAAGGSLLNDYGDAEGRRGGFQHQHRVYGRKGQPCSVCGEPIDCVVVNARATFYCRSCQPASYGAPRTRARPRRSDAGR